MESGLQVPASDEKEFCHFCFGAANLHLLFPLDRPELLSIIDNIIGISIAPEVHDSFSLCDECIATMDMFITFRNKCRTHYERLREMKIMNQAVKRMFPVLRDNTNQCSPIHSTTANECNDGGAISPNVSLVEATPYNSSTRSDNDNGNGSVRKRSSQHVFDGDSDSATKRARIQNVTKQKAKFHHIREIMNRLRVERLQNNDAENVPTNLPPVSDIQNINNNGNALVVDNISKNCNIICKPCVVVVQRYFAHQTDLCKL